MFLGSKLIGHIIETSSLEDRLSTNASTVGASIVKYWQNITVITVDCLQIVTIDYRANHSIEVY